MIGQAVYTPPAGSNRKVEVLSESKKVFTVFADRPQLRPVFLDREAHGTTGRAGHQVRVERRDAPLHEAAHTDLDRGKGTLTRHHRHVREG